MKKKLIIISLLVCLIIASLLYLKSIGVFEDKEAPFIEILEDDLEFFDYEDVDFLEYVKVTDASDFRVTVLNKYVAKRPGKREIKIKAEDENGNISIKTINVNIISSEEWNKYVNDNTYNYVYRNRNNDSFQAEKGSADIDAFTLAKDFIGMKGGCNEVAQAFINAYFGKGYNVLNTYNISSEDAKPGDIIYYTNGGAGVQHYAVYLGGSSALQGNINGTTVIGSVYMTHGSTPIFRRLVGLEE